MQEQELIPHLFRTEYRKIVSVLCKLFGIGHIEIAEDIASDTFLSASELWGLKGLPANPTAWLYAVAKNKTLDYIKHHNIFKQKIQHKLSHDVENSGDIEIDLSAKNINDSQLAMMFVVCHPCNSPEAQIGLALNVLCGFGPDEIANAFLTSREIIYKRLQRARQKLRKEKIEIAQPSQREIDDRLPAVAMSLYLLFNEGYYSANNDTIVRKDLCMEAMRLVYLLLENEQTNLPFVNALMALLCFQASRFDARLAQNGTLILYEDQDENLWDKELVERGKYFLNLSSQGDVISKYHLEAGIAYWHTHKENSTKKWECILQLYNQLLILEYSPVAALNRTYALAKANGKEQAIAEAEKINLTGNHLYHSLLGELYSGIDNSKATDHLKRAIGLAKNSADKKLLTGKLHQLEQVVL
jgi:RNA polymerase sigma-70 factor (ECF subfamily)